VMTGLVIWVAAILILLFTASSITFFAAYAVMGIGAGMLMPGYMAGASLAVPREQQGAVAGFSAATQGIGFILGPITSTVLYEVNQTLPLWCLVASMSLLFLMFIVSMSPVRHPITESVI
jgi:DHA1 family multidrug resistance protein-like MFS transporter